MGTPGHVAGTILLVLPLLPGPARLAAQDHGASVVLSGTLTENTYVAGGRVEVGAHIERDLVAAGGSVDVRRLVEGDVTVAGGSVNLLGPVGDDVRAAGGSVTVENEVGGDLVAAGGTVSVGPEARVVGRAWLTGGRVALAGRVLRELRVAAGTVTLGGEVEGDVQVSAGAIDVLPTARIHGDLVYASVRPARIAPGARIGGRITPVSSDLAARAGRLGAVAFTVAWAALLGGLIVGGVAWLLLLPRFAVSAARSIGSHPWRSAGLGLLLLVVTPVAALVLLATVIGIPVGLVVIALYAVALLLGYLTAAVFLGDLGARLAGRPALSRGGRLLSLILALLLLALIGLVPVLGGLIGLAAIVTGLGALADQAYGRWAAA